MEITDVTVTPVSAPLGRTVSGSLYTKERRGTLVVTIETDDGTTGRVYSGDKLDLDESGRMLVDFVRDDLAPLIEGEPLFSVESLWERMFAKTNELLSSHAKQRRLLIHAIGAVDTAVWETIGQATDTPLYQLWGGYTDKLPVIVIGGYYEDGKTLDDLVAEAEEYESWGMAGMKLKVGGTTVDEDIERLRAVREALGDEFIIACDANQGYSIDEAVEFATRAKEHGIRWFEEPVVWNKQYRGMRTVRERTGVPVTAGQSETTADGCQRLLNEESVDIINFDASLAGGPTAWRRAQASALLHDVDMAHHEEAHLAMHLLTSVPNGLYVEVFHPEVDPVWYDMVENTPLVKDGYLHLPDGPGLGLDLDDGFIEEYAAENKL